MVIELPPDRRGAPSEVQLLPVPLKDAYLKFNLEPPRIPERPVERYPIITIIGPPGAGKTEAAKRLKKRFGFRVLFERNEENEFVSDSYSRDDPDVASKSQVKFLLLKFQDYMRAIEISQEKPVMIEPAIKMDNFYDLTFKELGKITEEQYQKYLIIWNAMVPFVFREDLLISVIPDEVTYNWRIRNRGRDYEQAGFTEEFKRRITALCQEEEKKWKSQGLCLPIGDLDYVHGEIDSVLLIREFGLKTTELWCQEQALGADGAKVLCPEGWGRFRVGPMAPADCRFRKKSL